MIEVYIYVEKREWGYMENTSFKYKEVSITTKAFTTERKHKSKTSINISKKGSIVKEKCRQLVNIVLQLFPEGIILNEDLEGFVEDYCGADKTTVRAYIGYYGRIRRSKNSGEGYLSGIPRKGYLEKFGFMHRIGNHKWKVNQTWLSAYHNNEGSVKVSSNEKISLSTVGDGERANELVYDLEVTNNNNNTERERNFTPKIFPKISKES